MELPEGAAEQARNAWFTFVEQRREARLSHYTSAELFELAWLMGWLSGAEHVADAARASVVAPQ